MKTFLISLVFATFLLGGVCLAQQVRNLPDTTRESPKDERKVKAGKTVYDFEEVDILGKLKRPDTPSIVEPPEFRFRRLLDLDESFLPNIIRSVDEF